MDLEKELELKRINLEKLIRNADDAIKKEMLKYDEAEFYIRLKSECFNLYPVIVKALSLQIEDDIRRAIFCSIVKGHKLKYLADFYNMTPEDVVKEFRSAVSELERKVKSGVFTDKECVNIRLLNDKKLLQCKLRESYALHQKMIMKIDELQEQIKSIRDEKVKKITDGRIDIWKKKQALRRKIVEEVQEDMSRKLELQRLQLEKQFESQLENRSIALLENTPLREIIRMRCKKWFKTKILHTE